MTLAPPSEPQAPPAHPTDLRALTQTLMTALLDVERHDEARILLEKLFRLRGRFAGYAQLRAVLDGTLACSQEGSVYMLGEQPISNTMRRHFDDAVETCSEWLEMPEPVILLECLPDLRQLHTSACAFPGLASIGLSMLAEGFPDRLRATQFHEVAHCFLTCGVRLLDEGFAHYFAIHYGDAALPETDRRALPELRILLSSHADDLFDDAIGADLRVYRAACRVGVDLIEGIVARGGVDGLQKVFADVERAAHDAEVVALIEAASGWTCAPEDDDPAEPTTPILVRARAAVFRAWEFDKLRECEPVLQEIRSGAYLTRPELLDALLFVQSNRLLLKQALHAPITPDELASLDSLLKSASDVIAPGRLWLWRATRAVITICVAGANIIRLAVAIQQARLAFEKAAELIPDDPDLLVQYARPLLETPAEHGGDLALAAQKLRLALEEPQCREHVLLLMRRYGQSDMAAFDEPPMAPDEAAWQGRPSLVRAEHLLLRLSSGFCLDIDHLDIKRGECLAIVGKNGSGKTVLLEALLGLRAPDQGKIERLLDAPDERTQIGALLQHNDWPAKMRVTEIIQLHRVLYPHTEENVSVALGLKELKSHTWGELSRGQRQRVILWLALAHLPQLVFLDEPTLGLGEWFLRGLRELWTKLPITMIYISHVAQDLALADRIVCLEGGTISDSGTLPMLIERHVGTFKADIRHPLDAAQFQCLQTLPGFARILYRDEAVLEIAGHAGFDRSFRQFIDVEGITAFRFERASTQDFLAQMTRQA